MVEQGGLAPLFLGCYSRHPTPNNFFLSQIGSKIAVLSGGPAPQTPRWILLVI